MTFRKLTDVQVGDLYWQIKIARTAQAVLRFVEKTYGERAHHLVVYNDGDYSNLAVDKVEVVEVFDEDDTLLLPDFTLPYWQEVKLDLLPKDVTEDDILDAVYEHLCRSGEYTDAGFDPEEDGQTILLATLGQYRYPELYTREEGRFE